MLMVFLMGVVMGMFICMTMAVGMLMRLVLGMFMGMGMFMIMGMIMGMAVRMTMGVRVIVVVVMMTHGGHPYPCLCLFSDDSRDGICIDSCDFAETTAPFNYPIRRVRPVTC